MTTLTELKKLAEAANGFVWGMPEVVKAFSDAANPETILALLALVDEMGEALRKAYRFYPGGEVGEALAKWKEMK